MQDKELIFITRSLAISAFILGFLGVVARLLMYTGIDLTFYGIWFCFSAIVCIAEVLILMGMILKGVI